MASRKLIFEQNEEDLIERDTDNYGSKPPPWRSVEENFNIRQKQSAWGEEDISDFPTPKSRERFSYDNAGYVVSEPTKDDVGIKTKPKKKKRTVKKKGRISEGGHDVVMRSDETDEMASRETGFGTGFMSWKTHSLEGRQIHHEEVKRRPDKFATTTVNVMETVKKGYEESEDESISMPVQTVMSTPTTQRQSVSWSPSPIPRKGSSKLPPLPAFPEESTQKSTLWLNTIESGDEFTKDTIVIQREPVKKKKRKKKLTVSVNIEAPETQDANDNMGEAFELSLLKSDSAGRKKRKGLIEQESYEESSLDPTPSERRPVERLRDFFTKRESHAEVKPEVLERTFIIERPTTSAEKNKNEASDKSSGSDGVDGGTYSISPKRSAVGVAAGEGTGDEESDGILDGDSSGDQHGHEDNKPVGISSGKKGIEKRTASGRSGIEKRPSSGRSATEKRLSDEEEKVSGGKTSSRRDSGSKLLTMEQLGLGTPADPQPMGWEISSSQDVIWSFKEAILWEKDAYFYPSSHRAPVEERLPPGNDEHSFLGEDELLPVKPFMSSTNHARLENRILAEGNRNWFGEDGELLALPNPIRSGALRPPHIPLSSSSWDLPAGLQIEYRPALVGVFGKGYEDDLYEVISQDIELGRGTLTRSKRRRGCLLEVEILSVEFAHHPLFSKEHVLAHRLLSLWAEWESRRASGKAKTLAEKVVRIRDEKKKLAAELTNVQRVQSSVGDATDANREEKENQVVSDGPHSFKTSTVKSTNLHSLKRQLHYKLQELQRARIERDSEGKTDRKTLESLLFAWRDIKLLRQEQGFSSTPLRLYIQAESKQKRRKKVGNPFGYASDVSAGEDGRSTYRVEEPKTNVLGKKVKKDGKSKKSVDGIVVPPVKPRRKLIKREKSVDVIEPESDGNVGETWMENELKGQGVKDGGGAERMTNQRENGNLEALEVKPSVRERWSKAARHVGAVENSEVEVGGQVTKEPRGLEFDGEHGDAKGGQIYPSSGGDDRISKVGDYGDGLRKKKKKRRKWTTVKEGIQVGGDRDSAKCEAEGKHQEEITDESAIGNRDTANSPSGDGIISSEDTEKMRTVRYRKDENQNDERLNQLKMSSRQRRRERLKSFYLAELSAAMELSGLAREHEGSSHAGRGEDADGKQPVPAPRISKGEGDSAREKSESGVGLEDGPENVGQTEDEKEVDEEEMLAAEWREWKNELEMEVEERMEEAQAEWELEMEQYRIMLEEWELKREMFQKNRQKRRQKRLKDKAKERKRGKKGEKEPLTGSISEDEEEEEEEEGEEEGESGTGTNDDEWVVEKPLPPEKVDPRVIRFEVEETMKASRRPPGEPRLILKLLKDIADDSKMTCPKEKERRFAVELTEIQARIFYNGQEACRSKPIPLTQAFSPIVDHAFSIRGLGPPSSLAIELFERLRGHSAAGSGIGGWYPMALIHLPVPSRKITLKEDTLPERLEFGNDKVVAHPHAAVGSGIYFSPFPDTPDSIEEERPNLCLHLSGGIWCRLGWAVNEDGVVLSPKGYSYLGQSESERRNEEEIKSIRKLLIMTQRGAGATGWNSSKNGGMERLRQLAEDARAKASTRANDEMFQLIEDWSLSRLDSKEHFRLDPLMEEFKFDGNPWRKRETKDNLKRDGDDWWAVNRRLRILHLRDKGVPEFRSLHCIPLNDREIPQDIFKGYENRIQSQLTHNFSVREDLNSSSGDTFTIRMQRGGGDRFPSESGGCDPHEGRREWGRKFLQEARFRLLQQSHLVRKQQKRLSDLVIEEQVPTMGSLGMTLLESLKPKRPLKPMRRSWLGSSMASGVAGGPGCPNPPGSSSREVQVKVNVVRAFGVPVRRDIDPVMDSGPWNSPSSSSRPWYWEPQQSQILSEHGLAEVLVRPFVEVALGTARARTTTALGVNPTWNQELQLTLNLETSMLEKTKKQNTSLFMNAFDHTGDEFDSPAWWTSNGDVNSIEDLYLSILLKDEAVVDLLVDNRAREAGEIHQTTQKHFLASLRIPLTTLRFNQRMEGTFRMSSPPVLLGYTREEIAFGSGQYSGSARLLPITSPVPGLQPGIIYLTLFITVQPPLPALHMDFEDEHVLESIELPHVESHLRAWEMEVFRTVNRGCCPPKALVPDLVGKTVCATRFLRPLAPPPGLPLTSKRGSGAVAADWLARFVSMIPLSTGHQLTDIWLNSEQMLRLLCGSRVDHAILLTCLFMHLGLEVWLAQGSGLPDGPNCAFVLTKGIGKGYTERKWSEARGKSPDHGRVTSGSRKSWKEEQASGDEESEDFEAEYDSDWWVWDPIRGQRFEVRDPFCPLQHLWWLTNDQNIWANVQRDDQPQHMNFNLELRRDWWPAFSQAPASGGLFVGLLSFLPRWFSRFDSGPDMQIQAPSSVVGSVQPESLPYESRAAALLRLNRRKGGRRKGKDDMLENNPDLYLKLLEERLENHLQSCVMHWRKNNLTIWNRHGSSLLRKLLPRLEHPIVGSTDHSLDENHLWELKSLMSSHKVCGFPINVPYDGMASAREALRTTGVHSINEPGVEFALAVYLHPYCGIKGESSSILSLWVYVASLVNRRSHLD